MRLTSLLAFAAGSLAAHVLHEKRDFIPYGWEKGERVELHALLPMRIALTQQNIDQIEKHVMEVSDPASENYGNHWSAKKVLETYAPKQESQDTVMKWLVDSGIEKERLVGSVSKSLGWIHLDVTAAELEHLLQTSYHKYTHGRSGKVSVATEAYFVPAHVQPHIDFITPTLHFDARVNSGNEPRDLETRTIKSTLGQPGSGSLPKVGATFPNIQSIFQQLKNCSDFITPVCLEALYLIPPALTNVQKNPIGIVEYTPQAYLQGDLNTFFAKFSPNQRQKTPTLVSIDGGYDQTAAQGFEYNGESNLDLEYAMTLVNPISTTLYQVGDAEEGASFNDFLDALDGSYCTYEGGDDPTQDATYPDPLPGGYKGPKECGGAPLTKVISTSYAYNEHDLTSFYEHRQCNEYAKLAMMGTSVLYSSGDYGVGGNGGQCIDPVTGNYTDGSYGNFNPSFPGTCPYITSVGATQIVPGNTVLDAEEACETVIYSGGGFSNNFALPDYQKSAVQAYQKANPNTAYAKAGLFNDSGKARGFPDVSANGANYIVQIDGQAALVFGTSASTPVFASIVSIINEYRAVIGKKSLGFLNPMFYAHPEFFNDITKGGNQGCGTAGFQSVKGWDPVTGLGTPNSLKILAYALGLP